MAGQLAAAGGSSSGTAAHAAAPTRFLQQQQQQQPGLDNLLRFGSISSSAAAARRRLQLQHRRTLHQQQQQHLHGTYPAAPETPLGGSSSSRGLQETQAAAGVLPRINLLGSGQPSLLALPHQLRPHVFLYKSLGYEEYYDTLCR
jgi:hypothetical protein